MAAAGPGVVTRALLATIKRTLLVRSACAGVNVELDVVESRSYCKLHKAQVQSTVLRYGCRLQTHPVRSKLLLRISLPSVSRAEWRCQLEIAEESGTLKALTMVAVGSGSAIP